MSRIPTTRHAIEYGESLRWEPPVGTNEFYLWGKRLADGYAMRWRQIGGYSLATDSPIAVPDGPGAVSIPGPLLNMAWGDLLTTFDGFDTEILQVTAHGIDARLVSIDVYALPAPTSINAASIAARERRVLRDLLETEGGGIEPPLPYRVDGLAIRCITALPSLRRIAVRNRGPAGDPVPGAALATPRSRMWRFGLSMRGRALPPGPPSCPSVSPYCCRIPAAFPLLSYCGGGGICMPRSTAGRLPTASNQRFTFGKSARSICCHSRRNTQGQVAISAIE